MPLGLVVSGANTHDMRLVLATVRSIPIRRPRPTRRRRQHCCADKGYDYPEVRELLKHWGYTAHIKSRGEEEQERKQVPGYRARRWVVEPTHSCIQSFPSSLDSLGEECRQLPRLVTLCLRVGHLPGSRGFGIGSYGRLTQKQQ